MAVTETLMEPGGFTVPLRVGTPWDTLEDVAEFGHIVITPQWLDPRQHTDTVLLAAARYAGPVLEKRHDGDMTLVSGSGMVWWLGDALGHGDLTSLAGVTAAQNWQTAMGNILPAGGAITAGTYHDPATTTWKLYDGAPNRTPLEHLRVLMAQIDGEYRVNPDGTIDAGDRSDLFTITAPTVIASRRQLGWDSLRFGLHARTITTTVDASRFITAGLVNERWGFQSERAASNWTATHSYKDIHGNTMQHERVDIAYGTGADTATTGPDLTDQFAVDARYTVETEYWQLDGADLRVGDAFYVFDPPFIVDTANAIPFRGEWLPAKSLRCLTVNWPLTDGMGVYYRDKDGAWLDLTRWVAWETTRLARIECGEPRTSIGSSIIDRTVE